MILPGSVSDNDAFLASYLHSQFPFSVLLWRLKMSQTHSRMVHWLICVEQPCCGGPPPDCGILLLSNSWSAFDRSWTLRGLSVLWASTRWPSPAWPSARLLTRSNPGFMSTAVTYTATTTGATGKKKGPPAPEAQHLPAQVRGSALCVEE